MKSWRNRGWPALLLCAALLSACQATTSVARTEQLDVTKVILPASVGAGAEMIVGLTVGEGCAETVPDVVAQRTAFALRVTVQRTIMVPVNPVPCPAVYIYVQKTYSDPGSPPRAEPFEVFVNGRSYGTVAIR